MAVQVELVDVEEVELEVEVAVVLMDGSADVPEFPVPVPVPGGFVPSRVSMSASIIETARAGQRKLSGKVRCHINLQTPVAAMTAPVLSVASAVPIAPSYYMLANGRGFASISAKSHKQRNEGVGLPTASSAMLTAASAAAPASGMTASGDETSSRTCLIGSPVYSRVSYLPSQI